MSRIDDIKAYGKKRLEESQSAEREMQARAKILENNVTALRPRIEELIKTANACIAAGIKIMGTIFVTNGISHRIGFVHPLRGRPITHMGIQMGGCCGDQHLRTDGVVVYSETPRGNEPPVNKHMEAFLNGFDDFEKAFYNYVDNIVKEG